MEDLLSLDRAPQVGGPRPLHSFLHSEKPFRIFFPPTINLKKIKKEEKKKKGTVGSVPLYPLFSRHSCETRAVLPESELRSAGVGL